MGFPKLGKEMAAEQRALGAGWKFAGRKGGDRALLAILIWKHGEPTPFHPLQFLTLMEKCQLKLDFGVGGSGAMTRPAGFAGTSFQAISIRNLFA